MSEVWRMDAAELARSAANDDSPPDGLNPVELALWHARAGNWDLAHDFCQEIPGEAGSWVHAHLHREEGDPSNAAYWYARAGRPVPASHVSIADEWEQIAAELVG